MFPGKNPVIHETEYIWDDKRKIIINSRNLTDYQYAIYKRSMYKRLRPDLTEYDFQIWKEKYRLGEVYLNELRKRLNWESLRLALQGHSATLKVSNKVLLIINNLPRQLFRFLKNKPLPFLHHILEVTVLILKELGKKPVSLLVI